MPSYNIILSKPIWLFLLVISFSNFASSRKLSNIIQKNVKSTPVKNVIVRKQPFSKISKTKSKLPQAIHHENQELMSASTAIANVLADLCPHGMLPIGM